MVRLNQIIYLCLCALFAVSFAADKNKPHGHPRILYIFTTKKRYFLIRYFSVNVNFYNLK